MILYQQYFGKNVGIQLVEPSETVECWSIQRIIRMSVEEPSKEASQLA